MTAAAHADDRGDSGENGFLHWVGHHEYSIFLVLFASSIGLNVLRFVTNSDLRENLAVRYGSYAVSAAIVLAAFQGMRHARQVCTRCFNRHPDDGPHTAEARKPTLRRFHWAIDHPKTATIWVGGAFALCLFGPGFIPWEQVPPRISATTGTVTTLIIICVFHVGRVHSRLQRWCPWCNPGHGDDVVEPVPDPGMTKIA